MTDQSGVKSSNESPYFGGVLQFKFGRDATAYVPREAINKHPEFAAWVDHHPADEPVRFAALTKRMGHTIVHFLLTGTYQTLPLPSDDEIKQPSAAFIEALEVYQEALYHGLGELARMATEEIDRQGQDETFASIVKGVEEVCGGVDDDKTWLIDYLVSRATMADEVVTRTDIRKLQARGSDRSLAEILLEGIMKVKFQLQQAEENDASMME